MDQTAFTSTTVTYWHGNSKQQINKHSTFTSTPIIRQSNGLPSTPYRKTRRVNMSIDPTTVGTGYAFLDSLKGVVIGPTINEITAAIAGGTVGVMSTIIALEVRRQHVKERKQCPYCRGTGKLPCANCCTLGAVPSSNTLTAQEACSCCGERGYLLCNHVSITSMKTEDSLMFCSKSFSCA